MFVQIIEGRVRDADAFRSSLERWENELRAGATGYLGTTAGVTPDNRMFALARFESREAAAANSSRSEQDAWWREMVAALDGEPSVTESEDVESFLAGGSDEAGFVQAMKTPDVDRAKVAELDAMFEPVAADVRPDLIGGLRIWTEDGGGYDVNYFTSEAEARANESREIPPEMQAAFGEMQEMMARTEFFDLPDPWLR